MQDDVFPKIWLLNMCDVLWSVEPDSTKLRGFEPDHTELNQGQHHQIIVWDLPSSEILCIAER